MLLVLALIFVEQPQTEKYKPGFCFSPISAEDTSQYMAMLHEMRRSAFFAQTVGVEKLGRPITGQVKLIDQIIKSLREEHVCWNVKVSTVSNGKIVLPELPYIKFSYVECDEPWVKKLRRGDIITVKGIVTKIDTYAIGGPNDYKSTLIIEELVAEQYKPASPNRKR